MLSHAANNENDEATSKKTFLFCGASEGRPQISLACRKRNNSKPEKNNATRSLISSKYTLRLTLVGWALIGLLAALKFDECAVACTTSSVLSLMMQLRKCQSTGHGRTTSNSNTASFFVCLYWRLRWRNTLTRWAAAAAGGGMMLGLGSGLVIVDYYFDVIYTINYYNLYY